jgi:hypothetical protein
MRPYAVVIPAHLHHAYWQLGAEERLAVRMFLHTLGKVAAATHDMASGESLWSDLAGLSAGVHRTLFGELWLSYRVTPDARELRLLDFGEPHLTSRVTAPPQPAARAHSLPEEERWDGEGGFDPAVGAPAHASPPEGLHPARRPFTGLRLVR